MDWDRAAVFLFAMAFLISQLQLAVPCLTPWRCIIRAHDTAD